MKLRVAVLLCSLWLLLGTTAFGDPNPYEARILKKQIMVSYNALMDMWHEELYFDMYNLGQHGSRKNLEKNEFAQRMVDLAWKPSLKPDEMRKMDVLYRNFANLHVRMEFENKIDTTRKLFKDMVFTAILEDKQWKFDLTQLIRTPYNGEFVYLKAEAKAAEAARLAEAAKAKAEAEAIQAAWEKRKKDFQEGKAQPTPDEEKRMQQDAKAKAAAKAE